MINDYHLINDNDLIEKSKNNYKQIFSEQEKQIIKELNSLSNKANEKKYYEEKFYNLSLKELFQNFLNTWQQIIEDFTVLFKKNKKKYKKNIYSERYWWRNIQKILFQIFYILTKEDRLIYVGIMLIIISFFVYFILLSS